MPRVADFLTARRDAGNKSFACFVTGGDPPVTELPSILGALEAGGASLIEVGLPFSDPIADGPTIQASSQRALDRGVRLTEILGAVKEAAVRVPVITMGYTNTALRFGFGEFAQVLVSHGVSGALLSDLIPDEGAEWIAAARDAGLDTVFLVAPTSTDERIRMACEASTGFVYCVSRTGVTGAESSVPADVGDLVTRVRRFTSLPVMVGFGISTNEQVRAVWDVADGAVVGSHIVGFLHEHWKDGAGAAELSSLIAGLCR